MPRRKPRSTSFREPSPEGRGGSADAPTPIEPAPTLEGLSPEARGRIVHFVVTTTLERGAAPTAVIALYADLSGDPSATRYVDQRYMLKQVPPDWRDVEDRVLEMEAAAQTRGSSLAAAWRRAGDVAMRGDDPLEQLARLAGVPRHRSGGQRSIFDDPEDLSEMEAEDDLLAAEPLADRLPDLVDLSSDAQAKIRRFAIEERLEHGLPPAELLELYRGFEIAQDERARQYLDRVFVDHEPPDDWLELQEEAQRVIGFAESRGRDAGRTFADVLRSYSGIDALSALHAVVERLKER